MFFNQRKVFFGKSFHYFIVFYLSVYISGCSSTRPKKPAVSIARALETRIYSNNMDVVLKASINVLQDMNYSIEVLNSDVGLISASRTTEENQAELDEETQSEEFTIVQKLALVAGIVVIVSAIFAIINIITGDDGDEDDEHHRKKRNHTHNNYFGNNSKEKNSPKIYRYKITVNLNGMNENETNVRVSAAGEVEENGRIIQTGGIHESEFFQNFFSNMNKALFLEENTNGWVE